ncbi:MAG: PilZ domain-containing protein, partial [Synergistaceae bacterium]|nr:PilZ domain-containing protein [Synergistaceae bacterium]
MLDSYKKAYIYSHEKIYIGSAQVVAGMFGDKDVVLRISDAVMGEMSTSFVLTLASDSHGLVTFDTEMVEFKLEDVDSPVYRVKCELLKMVEIIQRRENFKVKVSIPITVALVDEDSINRVDRGREPTAQYPVEIIDLSASGVMFSSREEMDLGQMVEFTFDRTSHPFTVNAQIIRIQSFEDGRKGYGCKFINMPIAKESSIR